MCDFFQPRLSEGGRTAQVELCQALSLSAIGTPVGATALTLLLAHGHEAIDVALGAIVQGIREADGGRYVEPGKPGRRV